MLGLCLDILSRCVPRINLKQFFWKTRIQTELKTGIECIKNCGGMKYRPN